MNLRNDLCDKCKKVYDKDDVMYESIWGLFLLVLGGIFMVVGIPDKISITLFGAIIFITGEMLVLSSSIRKQIMELK